MITDVLRDAAGNRVGEIRTRNGKQELYDKYGRRLGEYDSRSGVTRERNGNRIGTGNLLLTLLRG